MYVYLCEFVFSDEAIKELLYEEKKKLLFT